MEYKVLRIKIPIYYKKNVKSKQNILIGMNWYRNASYSETNSIKKIISNIIDEQVKTDCISFDRFKLDIEINYKRRGCDLSNINAIVEKFALDALKKKGIIIDDSNEYHIGSKYTGVYNKENAYADITIYDESREDIGMAYMSLSDMARKFIDTGISETDDVKSESARILKIILKNNIVDKLNRSSGRLNLVKHDKDGTMLISSAFCFYMIGLMSNVDI